MRKLTKAAVVFTASCLSLFALSSPAQAATSSKVTKVSVSKSLTTVYPVKDGYRDSVKFKVSAKTTGGDKVHGSATLRLGGKVVKKWTLTKKNQTLTWDGRYHGVISGTYALTVSEKGQRGSVHMVKTSIKVSPKRLTAASYSTTVTANELFSAEPYSDYSEEKDGSCYATPNDGVFCVSSDSYYNEDAAVALLLGAKVPVPQQVQAAAKWGSMNLTVTQTGDLQSGSEVLVVGGNGDDDEFDTQPVLSDGSASGTVKYATAPTQVSILVLFGEYSTLTMNQYKITFDYTTLQ